MTFHQFSIPALFQPQLPKTWGRWPVRWVFALNNSQLQKLSCVQPGLGPHEWHKGHQARPSPWVKGSPEEEDKRAARGSTSGLERLRGDHSV